jgi:hypothetical protein
VLVPLAGVALAPSCEWSSAQPLALGKRRLCETKPCPDRFDIHGRRHVDAMRLPSCDFALGIGQGVLQPSEDAVTGCAHVGGVCYRCSRSPIRPVAGYSCHAATGYPVRFSQRRSRGRAIWSDCDSSRPPAHLRRRSHLACGTGAPPAHRRSPPEWPTARHRAAQCDFGWCWTGVAGWGRGAPQGALGCRPREGRFGKLGGSISAHHDQLVTGLGNGRVEAVGMI